MLLPIFSNEKPRPASHLANTKLMTILHINSFKLFSYHIPVRLFSCLNKVDFIPNQIENVQLCNLWKIANNTHHLAWSCGSGELTNHTCSMKIFLVTEGLYLLLEKESPIACLGYNCRTKFGHFNIKCGGGTEIHVHFFFTNEIVIFCVFIPFDTVCLLITVSFN